MLHAIKNYAISIPKQVQPGPYYIKQTIYRRVTSLALFFIPKNRS